MFNQIMMSQLGIKPKTCRQDILENLLNMQHGLTNIELASIAKTWSTARDISVELVAMKNLKLVVIKSYDESTYPPRGRWILTEAGRLLAESETAEKLLAVA